DHCIFSDNRSDFNFGGAINNNIDSTSTVAGIINTISFSTFQNNSAATGGGAIANHGNNTVPIVVSTIKLITSTTMSSNIGGRGGAIFNDFNAEIDSIANSTFSNNSAIGGQFV